MFKKSNFNVNIEKKSTHKASSKNTNLADEITREMLDENEYSHLTRKEALEEKDKVLRKMMILIDDATADSAKQKLKIILNDMGLEYNEQGLRYFLEGYEFALATVSFDQRLKEKGDDEGVAYKMCAVVYKLIEDFKDQK
jgi:hypothetical protein